MAVLDLAQLSEQLQGYQHKTRSWASQQILGAQRTLEADEDERQKVQRDHQRLREESQRLSAKQLEHEARERTHEEDISQLNSRISSALAQQAASTTKVNDQKACVTSDMQALEQERQGISQQQNAQTATLQALETASSMYRCNLALTLQQSSDQPGQLEILLGNLHPDQECAQAAVGISINEDQQYEVTKCKPPLEDLPAILAALNRSTDFSAFVRSVRRLQCLQAAGQKVALKEGRE